MRYQFALSLAAGAVTSLAIALASSIWADTQLDPTDASVGIGLRPGTYSRNSLSQEDEVLLQWSTGHGRYEFAHSSPPRIGFQYFSAKLGWPIPFARWERYTDFRDPSLNAKTGIAVPKALLRDRDDLSHLAAGRRIPLSVSSTDALLNAGLLATPYLLAALAISYVLARRRIRRGHCRACAHPLAHATTCPECGIDLTRTGLQAPRGVQS